MKLPRIDRALVDCENHLHSTASFNTEIESLLTYSLLVVIYAEFEQMVNVIVQEKCNSIEDEALRELAKSCIGSVSRIQSSQMGDMLERFGAGRKAAFRNEITANQGRQRAETFYNNLITNRHDTAHSIGSNLTFGEVKRYYQEGQDDCKVVRFAPSSSEMAGLQGWNCGFPLSRERGVGADSTGWKDFAIVLPRRPCGA